MQQSAAFGPSRSGILPGLRATRAGDAGQLFRALDAKNKIQGSNASGVVALGISTWTAIEQCAPGTTVPPSVPTSNPRIIVQSGTKTCVDQTCFQPNPPSGCQGQNLAFFPRTVSVTTTWYGECGLAHATEAICNAVSVPSHGTVDFTDFVRDINDLSGVVTFTYYPPHPFIDFIRDTAQVDDATAVAFLINNDIAQMMQRRPHNKFVFLQEANVTSNAAQRAFNAPGGDNTFLTRQSNVVQHLFQQWAASPEAKLWLNGISVFAMHDFSTQVANSFEFLPCSTNAQCETPPLDVFNLECSGGFCRGATCNASSNNDTQCNSLHPSGLRFVCCNTSNCGSLLGRCVLESGCDSIVTNPLQTTCPNGLNSSCASGLVCSSGHRCVDPLERAFLCGLGIRNHDGTTKPAWNMFAIQSGFFSARSLCFCPNNVFPCDTDCPTNQGQEQECVRWESEAFGVCFPQ